MTTDPEFVKWMEGADQKGYVRAQWNYYGDMGLRFDEVVVKSVVLGPGQLVTDDPMIGARSPDDDRANWAMEIKKGYPKSW